MTLTVVNTGVSEAFNEPLIAHPELVAFIGAYFKTDDLTSPAMKMAHVRLRLLVYIAVAMRYQFDDTLHCIRSSK